MELTQGVKMLATIFGVFTIAYVSRTFYDWLVPPSLAFANSFSGVCLPLLWDFLPISLMFVYHY